eukprot:5970071-Amphidinium_carterae.3
MRYPKRRVRRYPLLSMIEFIRNCKSLELGIPDSKDNWHSSNTTCKLPAMRPFSKMSCLRSSCRRAKLRQPMSLRASVSSEPNWEVRNSTFHRWEQIGLGP